MTEPNTTEAVTHALIDALSYRGERVSPEVESQVLAGIAIGADRKALAEQGYIICKPLRYTDELSGTIAKEASKLTPFSEEHDIWEEDVDAIAQVLISLGLPIEVVDE